MKIRKILSVAAASALAVSAIATNAFADAAHSGSYSFSDSTWWTQDWIMGGDSGKPVSDLIGDVDPSTVKSITFTSDTVFVIGYNNTEGGWSQPSDQTSYTLTDVLLESYTDDAGETHDPALCLCLSKGDGVEYTINWEVEADGAAAPSEPADDEASYDVDVQMAVQDSATWATQTSETVKIDKNGSYTFKLEGLSIEPSALTVLYIKDAYALEQGDSLAKDYASDISNIKLSYSLKINGNDVAIDGEMPTTLEDLDNGKVFDFCFFNTWATSYIALPDATITDVELVVTVSGGESAPAVTEPEESKSEENQPEESKPEESQPEQTQDEPEQTQAPASTEAAGDVNQPVADKNNADTGIEGVAAVAGLAVVATLGVVVAKKRK